MEIYTSTKSFFAGIPAIKYEGAETDNPLAYQYYDENRIVAGKPLKEHLRFAVAYWHSFNGTGADPFGEATLQYAWNQYSQPMDRAKHKMDAAFEMMQKLGVPFYCFHDVDLVEYTNNVGENEARLQQIVAHAAQWQNTTGIELLWGTANLFSHRQYMNGAATNPNIAVVAKAGAQVKAAIDATIALGGRNYVFWGGREGYMSLLNTDMKREKEHMARFLHMAVAYARANGFTGHFFIEPKPCEPSKHQYDYDAETVIGFLRYHGLDKDFKLNLEVNHATLAGHTFQHELQVAADNDMLGSIDANRGDYQNGWDTDQFPNNLNELAEAMLVILEAGGLSGGGINFDAKLRRNSTDPADLFYAHISGMDAFARAIIAADTILTQTPYRQTRANRYQSFDHGLGASFENGNLSLEDLRQIALNSPEPPMISGRQEYLELLINRSL
ncbi:MAG TPA: xylose isomerase [Phnomibacter sp.]|nr:xylose isomerase [Phnomibacter sp.]